MVKKVKGHRFNVPSVAQGGKDAPGVGGTRGVHRWADPGVVTGILRPAGDGVKFQRSAPLRTSNARMTPSGASVRWLSATADPTITRSRTTIGGDVTPYSQCYSGWWRRPTVRSIAPCAAKSSHGRPVRTSSAASRAPTVATKMRSAQG